jgi:UDP-N-acetylglucosamine:LPS N-acetylglucosamine transferase
VSGDSAGGTAGAATATGDVPLVLMVCSSGGHLAQLLALQPWWSQRRTRWVTFDTPDAQSLLAGRDVVPAHHPTTRNVPNLVRNVGLAVRTLRKERPDVIVSTGAGVALPFFVVGRLLGIPTVYIEVIDRVDSTTLTARLCRPFTTRMLVQWEEQQRLYPGSILVGPLL